MARALCVFTNLLGNNAMSRRMVDSLSAIRGLEPTVVLIDVEDYAKYPAPWIARLTEPWTCRYLARRKTEHLRHQPFDQLWVNSWEFAVEFQDLARKIPMAVIMDSVPATVNEQLRSRGISGWKRRVSHAVHHRDFTRATPYYKYFLPAGSDCLLSLQRDYGVPEDRCYITLAPQDTAAWTPRPKTYSSPLRLLFVGNDFVRKGGDFLLRLYSEHLANNFRLTIASNDPELKRRTLPAGVEWLQGKTRDQLQQVYQDSHLFVFPTRQDFMPQVVAESLSMGVPCMVNDVGGIRDLVQDGENGMLMKVEDSLEKWAHRLQDCASRPEQMAQLSAGARGFAEQHLNISHFQRMIEMVEQRMRSFCDGQKDLSRS